MSGQKAIKTSSNIKYCSKAILVSNNYLSLLCEQNIHSQPFKLNPIHNEFIY